MTPTCIYCRRETNSPKETYRAIEGWETIDEKTHLTWIAFDRFACRSCVDKHFLADEEEGRLQSGADAG